MIDWRLVSSLLVAFVLIAIAFIILAIIGLKVIIHMFTNDVIRLNNLMETERKKKAEREFERIKTESVWNFKNK